MSLATYQAFVKDCRTVLKQVEVGFYYVISIERKHMKYDMFNVSLYDESVDGTKKCLVATSREFKDNTAFYLHFVRDTLANLIVTIRGKPKWIIEPNQETAEYLQSRLRLTSTDDLSDIFLGGYLPNIIGGNPKDVRLNGTKSMHQLKKKIDKKEGEMASLKDRLHSLGAEIKRLRGNANYWEKRARDLEAREGLIAPAEERPKG